MKGMHHRFLERRIAPLDTTPRRVLAYATVVSTEKISEKQCAILTLHAYSARMDAPEFANDVFPRLSAYAHWSVRSSA